MWHSEPTTKIKCVILVDTVTAEKQTEINRFVGTAAPASEHVRAEVGFFLLPAHEAK